MRIELRSDSVVLDGYVNVTLRESRILPTSFLITTEAVNWVLPKKETLNCVRIMLDYGRLQPLQTNK